MPPVESEHARRGVSIRQDHQRSVRHADPLVRVALDDVGDATRSSPARHGRRYAPPLARAGPPGRLAAPRAWRRGSPPSATTYGDTTSGSAPRARPRDPRVGRLRGVVQRHEPTRVSDDHRSPNPSSSSPTCSAKGSASNRPARRRRAHDRVATRRAGSRRPRTPRVALASRAMAALRPVRQIDAWSCASSRSRYPTVMPYVDRWLPRVAPRHPPPRCARYAARRRQP